MTIEKATRLQNELRELFEKYGVDSGASFFVHNETIHFVEAHVKKKDDWVVSIMDALAVVIPQVNPNIPVVNFNSSQNN